MKTPVVTFDCDGVFANNTGRFTQLVNEQFGTHHRALALVLPGRHHSLHPRDGEGGGGEDPDDPVLA